MFKENFTLQRLHRPNFTEDELTQMKIDFQSFDVNNTGLVRPSVMLLFFNKYQFSKKNPIYWDAVTALNTEENNANGVSVDEFIKAVGSTLRLYNADLTKWKAVFAQYAIDNKKRVIYFNILQKVTKELGYKILDEELVKRLDESLCKLWI